MAVLGTPSVSLVEKMKYQWTQGVTSGQGACVCTCVCGCVCACVCAHVHVFVCFTTYTIPQFCTEGLSKNRTCAPQHTLHPPTSQGWTRTKASQKARR